jgi:transcriptional regulator with XRE-family HTH domain
MATVTERHPGGRPLEKDFCPLGERINALMARRGLEVKSLSELSGVPKETIYAIRTGDTEEPKASTLAKLATALGTTREKLTAGLF